MDTPSKRRSISWSASSSGHERSTLRGDTPCARAFLLTTADGSSPSVGASRRRAALIGYARWLAAGSELGRGRFGYLAGSLLDDRSLVSPLPRKEDHSRRGSVLLGNGPVVGTSD